jgi:predicted nucleic acid-binding protein
VIVVDASVPTKWFVAEDGHSLAASLLDRTVPITAPDLIFAETANVLWKKLRRGEVTFEQAESACLALPSFFQTVIVSASLLGEVLRLAKLLDHPVYDCLYLACAQRQGVKLVTADQKFVSTVKDHHLSHLVIDLSEVTNQTVFPDQSTPDSTRVCDNGAV